MKPKKIISQWLFNVLSGTFVEGTTLYVGMAEVEMGDIKTGGTVKGQTLNTGYSITGGHIYPIATQREIKGPYIVYDNIMVAYDSCKDGTSPARVSWRVLCVSDGYGKADALGDAVEEKLSDALVPELGSCAELQTRQSDYDPSTGEFIEVLNFKIDLQ